MILRVMRRKPAIARGFASGKARDADSTHLTANAHKNIGLRKLAFGREPMGMNPSARMRPDMAGEKSPRL